MKKLFWIPLFVILAVIPMIAGAEPVAGEPVAGNAGSPTATNAPKYALKTADAGDEKTVTASFVKGAYNAVIKGINNTQDEIDTLNTGIETYSDAIGHLTDGKATKTGTVATIKNATTTESINTSSVKFTGVTTTSISATASGNVNLSVPIMGDWETDSLAENPIETTASFTNLPVENLTMSAPSANTATLTKTGITGDVDVGKYLYFDFTKLINVRGNAYASKSAIYPDGRNEGAYSGLSNGEWTATWNAYGTVKGTSMCSSTSGALYGQMSSPSNTEGGACWCKMTGWTPNGGNATPVASLLWIRTDMHGSASDCARVCATNCGGYARDNSVFRSKMFSNVQN